MPDVTQLGTDSKGGNTQHILVLPMAIHGKLEIRNTLGIF